MSRSTTRPPSPSRRDIHNAAEEDRLAAALNAALSTVSSSVRSRSSVGNLHQEYSMAKEKEKSHLDVVVESDTLYLKGTGQDVEPALLTGQVVLVLAGEMSLKDITLQFRGKARLPHPTSESITLNNNPVSYSICTHDWSFLEGEKRNSHTLKAGRHVFPFQIEIGGLLPSSIFTPAMGGAVIIYKLRATAIRPGFAHNLQTVRPISIVRTLSPEALEYQQTLEIENTWPEKLMYSIMVPHKAWAATDNITALVKFSPIAKGVRVLNITTTIQETNKFYLKTGHHQEHQRILVAARHDIVDGKAVAVDEQQVRFRPLQGQNSPGSHSGPSTPGHMTPRTPGHMTPRTPALAIPFPNAGENAGSISSSPSHPAAIPSEAGPSSSPPQATSPSGPVLAGATDFTLPEGDADAEDVSQDVVSYVSVNIPIAATPTHALEPIIVSHRMRWSILISNMDGHTSELRCSLPVYILDNRLLRESRHATAATRRLLLGLTAGEDEEEEVQLPSYGSHVQDAMAELYFTNQHTPQLTPEGEVRRTDGTSPFFTSSHADEPSPSNLPHDPSPGSNTPLEWVDRELRDSIITRDGDAPGMTSTAETDSPIHSRAASRPASRRQSRASSPERHPSSSTSDTFVHGGTTGSRNLGQVNRISLKPLSNTIGTTWFHSSSRSSSHPSLSSMSGMTSMTSIYGENNNNNRHPSPYHQFHSPQRSHTFSTSGLSDVPDYGTASRFQPGSVPPLSSMRGLPSYADSERRTAVDVEAERNRTA